MVSFVEDVHRINPSAEVLFVSAKAAGGLEGWLAWIQRNRVAPSKPHTPEEIAARIPEHFFG